MNNDSNNSQNPNPANVIGQNHAQNDPSLFENSWQFFTNMTKTGIDKAKYFGTNAYEKVSDPEFRQNVGQGAKNILGKTKEV